MRKFTKSNQLFKKVSGIIPLASQTFSKSHLQFTEGAAPLFAKRGKGSHVWDVDDNEYTDYTHSMLPCVLGYQNKSVDTAIKQQLKDGILLSLPSPLEYELAALLKKHIPCAETARFGKNGSDVTAGAVRLARAVTGREYIAVAKGHYHGWHDWYIGTTARDLGVPAATKALTLTFAYNDLASLQKLFKEYPDKIAAVIMEPENVEEPKIAGVKRNFLHDVLDLTHRNSALLVFDEIITGFRWNIGGAQKYYNVTPDIACFGKSMGNGMPIAALVGKKEYMKAVEDIFFSFTFGGELLSIAAAIATIKELKEKNGIAQIWKRGKILQEKTKVLIAKHELEDILSLVGKPCWQIWIIKETAGFDSLIIKSFLQQELAERGILWYGQHNITLAHTEGDLARTLRIYNDVLPLLKDALERGNLKQLLRGKSLQNVFKIR